MDQINDNVRIIVTDGHHFVLDTLNEAGRGDLIGAVEDDDLADEVFIAINELVQILRGEIQISESNVERTANLRALIGRRYHINMKRTAWKALLASVPIVITLIRGAASHDAATFVQAGGSVLSVFEIFRENLQKLTTEEVAIYLALKALKMKSLTPCQAQTVADFLRSQTKDEIKWTDEAVQARLTAMVEKKILKKEDDGYRPVV